MVFLIIIFFSVMRRRARVESMVLTMSHHFYFRTAVSYVYRVPQRGCIISV